MGSSGYGPRLRKISEIRYCLKKAKFQTRRKMNFYPKGRFGTVLADGDWKQDEINYGEIVTFSLAHLIGSGLILTLMNNKSFWRRVWA